MIRWLGLLLITLCTVRTNVDQACYHKLTDYYFVECSCKLGFTRNSYNFYRCSDFCPFCNLIFDSLNCLLDILFNFNQILRPFSRQPLVVVFGNGRGGRGWNHYLIIFKYRSLNVRGSVYFCIK